MPALTPIKVRGKRTAVEGEKWKNKKQRREKPASKTGHYDDVSHATCGVSLAVSGTSTQKTRRHIELSQLEELPTEMLQGIFHLSGNVNLPIASSRLASQLASDRLHHLLTSRVLDSVLGLEATPSRRHVNSAMRLMDSKFFTWSFFCDWLHDQCKRLAIHPDWPSNVHVDASSNHEEWIWRKLLPHSGLLPPKKLLRSPFTPNKVRFLQLVTSCFSQEVNEIDAAYLEHAREGLEQAVQEGSGEVLGLFWSLGLQPDTSLFRTAVVEGGCKEEVVEELATRSVQSPIADAVDFLDPTLWSWADHERSHGNEKGWWLIDLLKAGARDMGRKEEDAKLE